MVFTIVGQKETILLFSALPGPGRAVPVLKVEEFSWKDEQEHEPAETEIPENVSNNLEINGDAVHSRPVGKFIRSLAAYHRALWRRAWHLGKAVIHVSNASARWFSSRLTSAWPQGQVVMSLFECFAGPESLFNLDLFVAIVYSNWTLDITPIQTARDSPKQTQGLKAVLRNAPYWRQDRRLHPRVQSSQGRCKSFIWHRYHFHCFINKWSDQWKILGFWTY